MWQPLVFICYVSLWDDLLLKSLLNIIIFFLSFLKMQVKVWIVKIHRRFLWKGSKKARRLLELSGMRCVSLSGKIGVRDLYLINLIFLVKWRWWLILGVIGLLCDILYVRYGAQILSTFMGSRTFGLCYVSS